MEYTPIWSGIIACYLFLGGLGGGAFATSAFLAWRHPEAVTMRKLGHWIAPIVVIVGLVLLMFDAKAGLHNPLRFALLLTNFGSVMTWGVVILAAFTVVALVALIMDLVKRRVPMWLEIVGAVLGICVAIYTGCLLGVCKTFPLWNTALLPILFLVSAMSTGMAAVLLNRSVIGENSIVAAHTLVPEGKVFPERSLIMGTPGKVVRQLTDEEVAGLPASAERYMKNWRRYRDELVLVSS